MSHRNRTLSVVIPCLNDADLLRTCLTSISEQTTAPDEVIVVDNGSTDDSAAVARAMGATVITEPRRGITWANAAGLTAASGDVLLRIDADVTLPPPFIEHLHRTWDAAERSGPRRVVAITGAGVFTSARGELAGGLYLGAYRFCTGLALGHYPLFGSNCCIRRDWWESVRSEVDIADTFVHDDMQLSFAVRADETVWFQEDLVVSMDSRALRGAAQLWTRFARGLHTVFASWRAQPPHRRLASRGTTWR
ncbi:glycosyltransferase family 2 protein [Corynebacterium pacaense]|uniref:glycosyltransferase family 2 protein n=1 Tax=Corynebacterium pacaense TaxID=1816684 RepID=UPI0009BAE3EE|nr:glycosyltransferase family 2 protein [Corynebacterium pacaense]